MNEIVKYQVIKREELNELEYFKSLLEKAAERGMITEEDVSSLHLQTLDLLKKRIGVFSGVDSSSIPVEEAEKIMESNIYTIGIYLKTLLPDDAVMFLKKKSLMEMYIEGKNIIRKKLIICKLMHAKILTSRLKTWNDTYNSTIIGGIKGFFKIYNYEFEANKMKITADYPLYNSMIGKLEGVEFIEDFLKSIYYENLFCKKFSPTTIEQLLYCYSDKYKDLIINIFEVTLNAAIGCELAGEEIKNLLVSVGGLQRIYNILENKGKEEVDSMVLRAYESIKRQLFNDNEKLQNYIEKNIGEVQSTIYNALQNRNLDKVFIVQRFVGRGE